MPNLFTRSKLNPILVPNQANAWEAKKLYNPGAVFYDGQYHLFYRAMGQGAGWQSAIGYAVSHDGENFKRFSAPLLTGDGENEKRGLEDPRITKIDDTFYMTYAAYDGITPRLNMATSADLKKWKKHGPIFSDWRLEKAGGQKIEFDKNGKPQIIKTSVEWSKSGALFPKKINGKYWLLFGEYQMWFATSSDGLSWTGDKTPFLAFRDGDFFDNTFVEMGPPPIETDKGWLTLYHGINGENHYQLGFLLLDLNNPRKILYRSNLPIFSPEESYELSGMVDVLPGGITAMQKKSKIELDGFIETAKNTKTMPKVVFCGGAVVINKNLHIFYGAGDSVICTAYGNLENILNLLK
jgi:beta-1,2-mannosidase